MFRKLMRVQIFETAVTIASIKSTVTNQKWLTNQEYRITQSNTLLLQTYTTLHTDEHNICHNI